MKTTALFCTALIIILGIYDLIVVSLHGVDASVSRFLQNAAFDSPMFVFMMGFIAGHVFGYMKPTTKRMRDE